MDIVHALVLALVQGITEFLPISSSGHLILLPYFVDWEDQGLAFDVSVHVGSLAAVVWYFRRDIRVIVVDWLASLRAGSTVGQSRLGWAVMVATLPAGAIGYVLNSVGTEALRTPAVVATTTVLFGVALFAADRWGKQTCNETALSWRNVVLIGLAQALALIPGTSRSGVTITAAMALGLTRTAAARFSFLLSIPLILAAGALQIVEAIGVGVATHWPSLIMGALVSGVSAYLCIHYFLKLVQTVGMLPFVVYRLALGALILALMF